MKCSRFSKILRGQEKYCFGRMPHENGSGDSDTSSVEDDHSEVGHEMHGMKGGCFKGNKMHHKFGHGHMEKSEHHGMEHGYRNRHGHHEMSYHHSGPHRMDHGHHMHHMMKHGYGKLHRMRHGHMKLHKMRHGHMELHRMRHGHMKLHKMRHGHMHKMECLFKHNKMGHGTHHKMKHGHWKMQHDDAGKQHEMSETRQLYPGKPQRESGNVSSSNRDSNNASEEEIRTYPSKCDAQVRNENNQFQISMNMSSYQPEEICVKIAKGKIDISAIHESVDDDLYEFHEMYRSFPLPENVNPENVTSRLESDGRLMIEATIISCEENSNEREVPVTMENDE